MKNNFDMSSTGINIECCAHWDTDISRCYYEDSFDTLWINNRTSIAFSKSLGNPEYVYEVADFNVHLKHNIIELLEEYADSWYDWKTWPKKDVVKELENIKIKYLPELLDKGIVSIKKGYKAVVSYGYSQGDRTLVICDEYLTRKDVDHLLWDCPVYAMVTINGRDYMYNDLATDEYEWDKKEFINYIVDNYTEKEGHKYIKEQLEKLLPEELDYV